MGRPHNPNTSRVKIDANGQKKCPHCGKLMWMAKHHQKCFEDAAKSKVKEESK